MRDTSLLSTAADWAVIALKDANAARLAAGCMAESSSRLEQSKASPFIQFPTSISSISPAAIIPKVAVTWVAVP